MTFGGWGTLACPVLRSVVISSCMRNIERKIRNERILRPKHRIPIVGERKWYHTCI